MTVGSEAVYISQLQAQLEEYKEDYKNRRAKLTIDTNICL